MNKFFSRKFLVTIFILLSGVYIPVIFKQNGISDNIMMAALAIVGGVGVAYGVINMKDAQLDKKKE